MRCSRLWLLLAAIISLGFTACAEPLPKLGENSIDEVIAALTLEEKVRLVMGNGIKFPGLPDDMQAPVVGVTDDKIPGAAGTTFAIPRLGIPSIVLADGPAGLRISPTRDSNPERTYFCTAFPIASLLASSWDTKLLEQVGSAIGHEVKEYGVDILLAPALNIHRYPLGGRNFEYYSEDPLVSGSMAAAMIRGVQSHDVGTSIKHFVANNHEWNRNTINVIADDRALREIYLKGFEIAVEESQPWTVMSSYNKLNGTYTSESAPLLSDVLRAQWNFSGLVMTDWFGGIDAVAQMDAGNDLLMPGAERQAEKLLEAARNGELDESVLDRNIENILRIILKTPTFNGYKYSESPDLERNAKVARDAAAQGMVLLRNDEQALPLKPGLRLALFGNNSYELVTGGTGSGDVNEAYSVSLISGLKEAGFVIDEGLANEYEAHITAAKALQPPVRPFMVSPPLPERSASASAIDELAVSTDVAVITIGRNSGEFADRNIENDFNLNDVENNLLATVSAAYHERGKKVIVVLNIGGVIETASWQQQVDAILLAWQPGQEAGNAIADILSGSVNPSGKLTTTFAKSLNDYPSAGNFPGVELDTPSTSDQKGLFSRMPAEIVYEDEIWVGYRGFVANETEPAYPFGYGLSYTQFAYSDVTLSSQEHNDKIEASVTITNDGDVPGREVVQLYISAPDGNLIKPQAELRAFAKTRLLQPRESQTLTFEITDSELISFDAQRSSWIADSGQYQAKIGASSKDIRATAVFRKLKAVTLQK